jgi:hypothetical protein
VSHLRCTAAVTLLLSSSLAAQTTAPATFVNGLAIAGSSADLSTGSAFDRRLGFFSDIYYDRQRNEWWGLSDRGPGGGTLPYDTRVQRFTLDIDRSTGAISNFRVLQTITFSNGGASMNGIAPSPTNVLGNAFDPEGIVINPVNGNLLVSDEYGPSLIEFNRSGELVRRLPIPPNIVPRNAATGTPNFASDVGNTAGKRANRGFEGLAISPDGRFAYAMLQSATLEEGGTSGVFARIVKYDLATGAAVGQFAYRMETSAQGRGTSALVALGNDKFLVLERNNRGIGIGATLAGADKSVFQIDLTGATDVTGITLGATTLPPGVVAVSKGAQIIDLDANTLAALGFKSPEKWEGLAIGPQLDNGDYLILAGTDNDYSVTQNDGGTQFDVWMNVMETDPFATSIQCPIGATTGCVATDGGAPRELTSAYALLPGVLHAYRASITGYIAPAVVPEPSTVVLTATGVVGLVIGARRRRRGARA